jgi:hypothetical protein
VIDATDTVRLNAERARRFAREWLLLVVSAENCAGCERLDAQLREPAVRSRLAGRAYVVLLSAGDLHDGPEGAIRIGEWTLESPGFPTTWAFRLGADRLDFCSLALGPLDEAAPDADVDALLQGQSRWVPEAGWVSAQACSGLLCLPLSAKNGFHADFAIPLPP